jgi:hypothetical protein
LRKIDAGLGAKFIRSTLRPLLALAFRQLEIALAGDVEHFINLAEGRIAGEDLFATLNRCEVRLLESEVVPRDLKIVERVFLQIRVPDGRRIRTRANSALGKHRR